MDKTIIHVRFSPDGTVTEIGERPEALSSQQWFNFLSDKAGTHYQTLAGGRGLFRLAATEIEALRQSAAA